VTISLLFVLSLFSTKYTFIYCPLVFLRSSILTNPLTDISSSEYSKRFNEKLAKLLDLNLVSLVNVNVY